MFYPSQIQDKLGVLKDAMLSPPAPSEIDANGCFSKAACNAMDQEILEAAGAMIKTFELPPDIMTGSDPNNRWRTVSSMQKAIRFGLSDDAALAASAVFDMDRQYGLRRLGVIAIEDCFMGNPVGTLIALASLGYSNWRKAVDERRFMVWLARNLSEGDKDRATANLIITAMHETRVPKDGWGTATDAQLAATAMNTAYTYPQRMCALWLMAGTRRYEGEGFPVTNDRSPIGLFRLMVELGMPRMSLYLAAKTASRLSEPMFATLPLIHEMLNNADPWVEVNGVFPDHVGILLGAAYDQYTREGRLAITRFFKTCPAMAPYLAAMPAAKAQALQFAGVFHAEGGTLRRRFVYSPKAHEMTEATRGPARFASMGKELSETFTDVLRANLGDLNVIRGEILTSKGMA